MKKKILTITLLILFGISENMDAQQYDSAVGARLGFPLSISYKKYISETGALEFYGGTRGVNGAFNTGYRWWSINGAYQVHKPLNLGELEGLDYYFGGGASIFFWTFDEGFGDDFSTVNVVVQGYLGLSYTFEDTPINITLDWVPTYFVGGFLSGVGAGFGGVGIRYVFSK